MKNGSTHKISYRTIVTGTRIARDANPIGALPVQSMDADDIGSSGEFSLADVVNDVPALLPGMAE